MGGRILGEFGVAARDTEPTDDHEPDRIVFCGEEFDLADHVGAMPFLQFADAMMSGATTADAQGDAALYGLLRDTIAADQFARFQSVATEHKAQASDLLAVVRGIIQARSGRPTQRPSDSADGPSPTGESSRAPSSSEESSPPRARPKVPLAVLEEGQAAVDRFVALSGRDPRRGPIMDDPRVTELRPIDEAARELALTS